MSDQKVFLFFSSSLMVYLWFALTSTRNNCLDLELWSNNIKTCNNKDYHLTLSQTSPGFYVSAVQVFWKHCGKRRNYSIWAITSGFSTLLENFLPFSSHFHHIIWYCGLQIFSVWRVGNLSFRKELTLPKKPWLSNAFSFARSKIVFFLCLYSWEFMKILWMK